MPLLSSSDLQPTQIVENVSPCTIARACDAACFNETTVKAQGIGGFSLLILLAYRVHSSLYLDYLAP